ncbi:Glutamine--fructose-6-phosphate aminotransferase [isomerizing] [Candidatus Clavichlamydia salmonicola]|uniref:glutamine--fructose-6-phosphate transaminase (isomerizing) n=1 Tax=Candidatus Clavichlamydia salmonicola TaxID=469812 RepID=UPI00189135E3|nr:glutamine--fructose-6-phosphate transaminase (isomerizing) [Candidatus Clavichlamydia salmonicola]MBF5050457.1 Glutamine--fructose-6-phosphate aminotransferase [isomerizing] [Candidatus Clavichlamydia salmonicola]
MCGMYGCIGENIELDAVINGLEKLQYRGYDSSGLAGLNDSGQLIYFKAVGPVPLLRDEIEHQKNASMNIVMGHTRWATHGHPSQENTHPHFDSLYQCAVVHNGIIENYEELKKNLEKQKVSFLSDTDTEVIPQLIAYFYKGDLLTAVRKTTSLLQGRFAFVVVHKDSPKKLICINRGAPIIIGKGEKNIFFSSDSQAFPIDIKEFVYLRTGETAEIIGQKIQIYNDLFDPILPEKWREGFRKHFQFQNKGLYAHHMLQEIWEQPKAITAILNTYISNDNQLLFNFLDPYLSLINQAEKIVLIGCGSSYHAALLMAYLIEDRFSISASAEIASEFRYRNPVISHKTLAIVISQSGETADTLAVLEMLKEKQILFIISVCNEEESSLVRETDASVILHVGKEVGVASTKAFTGQLMAMLLLFLKIFSFQKPMTKELLESIKKLPEQIKNILKQDTIIAELAEKYSSITDFFFLGRGYMFPIACEGALKLKEIAYVSAQGYPAGEMKHGPLALVESSTLAVAFCKGAILNEKIKNNLLEIKARKGFILAIVTDGEERFSSIADDIISIPDGPEECIPILMAVVSQLFAYYIALKKGTDIDCPRNLAKSVTVE